MKVLRFTWTGDEAVRHSEQISQHNVSNLSPSRDVNGMRQAVYSRTYSTFFISASRRQVYNEYIYLCTCEHTQYIHIYIYPRGYAETINLIKFKF